MSFIYGVSAFNSGGEGETAGSLEVVTFDLASQPLNLSATADPWVGEISLSWSYPASDGGSAVSSYAIYRGSNLTTLRYLNETNDTAYVDSGLVDGRSYIYEVRAKNLVGDGPPAIAEGRTFAVPTLPLNLTGMPSVPTGISLTWDAPADDGGLSVDHYDVTRRSSNESNSYVAIGLNFSDEGLYRNTTYVYTVTAVNAVGPGAAAEVEVTTLDIPSKPLNVSVEDGPRKGQVTVSWNSPADTGGLPLDDYKVHRRYGNGSAAVALSNLTHYEDETCPGTCSYWIVAQNPVGEGPPSQVASGSAYDSELLIPAIQNRLPEQSVPPDAVNGTEVPDVSGTNSTEVPDYPGTNATHTEPVGADIATIVIRDHPGRSRRFLP